MQHQQLLAATDMLSALRRILRRETEEGQVLYPGLPDGLVVYAVGDIHGCLAPLESTLSAIETDKQNSRPRHAMTVFLGDYVDRGPDSAAVLDLLVKLRKNDDTIMIKGNHDAMLEAFALRETNLADWLPYGGASTLKSYGAEPDAIAADAPWLPYLVPQPHLDLIAACPFAHRIGDYFFTHAGVRPGTDLEHQSPHDLMWIRDDFLRHRGDFGAIVVHGHTPAPDPEFRANRICIDTGAYMTGRMSCLRIDAGGASLLHATGTDS